MRRLVPVLVAILLPAAAPAWADAPAGNGCAAIFPDTAFDTSAQSGSVTVWGVGLSSEVTSRFAEEFLQIVEWLEADVASLDGVEVCLFADELEIDAEALGWYPGLPLRAAAFGEHGVVALSAWMTRYVQDAGVAGLIHVALWRAGEGAYPEPFGDDVVGWYLGRLNGTTEAIHNLYLRQQIGLREPWPPFPWTASTLADPLLWKPEYGYGGAGDFTDFVVGIEGSTFLRAPEEERLIALDAEWRQALFDESGAIPGGSKGWIFGMAAAAVLVAVAIGFAWLGRRSRLQAEEALRQLATATGGASPAGEAALVRPSVGGGPRRGHARVGGSGADAVGPGRDDRDRSPGGRQRRSRADRMAEKAKPGDEIFRHPGFRDED
jgi:hypothetical protein